MENKVGNTQPMSEWDKRVCAHLDGLWNKHHSGELKTEDVDVVFANARNRVEQVIKDQQAHKAEPLFTQSRNYAM